VYQVLVRCPVSMREVPLGIEIADLDSWGSITFVRSLYLCASCGQTHLVNKRYARLQAKGTVLTFKRPAP
jgi:hypothetical protein